MENYQAFNFEEVQEPKIHDIVLFKIDINSPIPSHAGILVEPDKVLSAEKFGTTLLDISKNMWRRRITGYYRLCQN